MVNTQFENYKNLGSIKIRTMLLHSQHFHNKLITNPICTGFNLEPILILFFYPSITTFCIRFIVKML